MRTALLILALGGYTAAATHALRVVGEGGRTPRSAAMDVPERSCAMPQGARGLTEIGTEDLKRLLGALHRRDVACPLTIEGLTRVGLQHCATTILAMMRGLDERGARAVLVAVIAERLAAE